MDSDRKPRVITMDEENDNKPIAPPSSVIGGVGSRRSTSLRSSNGSIGGGSSSSSGGSSSTKPIKAGTESIEVKKTSSSSSSSTHRTTSLSSSSSSSSSRPKSTIISSSSSSSSNGSLSSTSSSTLQTKRPPVLVRKSQSSLSMGSRPKSTSTNKLNTSGGEISNSDGNNNNNEATDTIELERSLTTNASFKDFDPEISPEFEKVVSDFIILDEDENTTPLYINQQSEYIVGEEIKEEDDLQQQQHREQTIINQQQIIYEEIQKKRQEQEEMAMKRNSEINNQQQVDENKQQEAEEVLQPVIEIKKTSSWMSSFFNKVLPASLSSASLTTTTTTTTAASATVSNINISSGSNIIDTTTATASVESTSTSISTSTSTSSFTQINSMGTTPPLSTTPPLVNSNGSEEFINKKGPSLTRLPPPKIIHSQSFQHIQHQQQQQSFQSFTNLSLLQQQQQINISSNNMIPNNIGYHNNNNNNNINSNSNQSIMVNNMFLPHNQPGGLALLPFTITSNDAIMIFQKWFKSLWFAPTDFKDRLEESLKLEPLFIPYYAFSTIVHSVHSGKVGFLKQHSPSQQEAPQHVVVVQKDQTTKLVEEEEVEWMLGSTNPYSQTHNDILIYAPEQQPNDVNNGIPTYEYIKEINQWRLDQSEPFHHQHPQLLNSITDSFFQQQQVQLQQQQIQMYNNNPQLQQQLHHQLMMQQQQQQQQKSNYKGPLHLLDNQNIQSNLNGSERCKVIDKMDWEKSWALAELKIKKNEAYGNDSKLKKDYQAHTVALVETQSTFENIKYRTVYVPMYKLTYNYNNRDYMFVINGQNGKSHGIRPYGAGSIKNTAIKFLTGGFVNNKTGTIGSSSTSTGNTITVTGSNGNSNNNNSNNNNNNSGLVSGEYLNQQDSNYFNEEDEQIQLYSNDSWYLLLPSSDQFLLYQMVGYIVLRNNSTTNTNIVLESHKRMSEHIGGQVTLSPGETQTFSFKGTWCIEIKSGENDQLQIIRIETNSGGDKPSGDLLMCS